MISKLICALFGHAPLTNVLGRTGYADVCGAAFDGIKRGHLYLTADCPRCGATYSICNVHAYAEPPLAKPEAQPVPSVPDGWKLVSIEPTEEMYNAGANHCDGYWSTAQAVWDAMLAAAPEAKP